MKHQSILLITFLLLVAIKISLCESFSYASPQQIVIYPHGDSLINELYSPSFNNGQRTGKSKKSMEISPGLGESNSNFIGHPNLKQIQNFSFENTENFLDYLDENLNLGFTNLEQNSAVPKSDNQGNSLLGYLQKFRFIGKILLTKNEKAKASLEIVLKMIELKLKTIEKINSNVLKLNPNLISSAEIAKTKSYLEDMKTQQAHRSSKLMRMVSFHHILEKMLKRVKYVENLMQNTQFINTLKENLNSKLKRFVDLPYFSRAHTKLLKYILANEKQFTQEDKANVNKLAARIIVGNWNVFLEQARKEKLYDSSLVKNKGNSNEKISGHEMEKKKSK